MQQVPRPRLFWLDGLALISGAGALWSFLAAVFDDLHAVWIPPLIVTIAMTWGIWQRRPWGRWLAQLVCCFFIVAPPIVMLLARLEGSGRDSIGSGILFAFGTAALLFVTPLAIGLLWLLARPGTKVLFSQSSRTSSPRDEC